LKARGKPYYKEIGKRVHLGYRKGKVEGKWVVRTYTGSGYVTDTIANAVADDIVDADGTHVLTFFQAQDKAREIAKKSSKYIGPYRVRDAWEDYRSTLANSYDATSRANMHILPKLGDVLVESLSADQIRAWHRGMVKGGDAEQERKQKSSANRVLTILKATLNRAFREGKAVSDAEWRRVEPFESVDASRTRYLSLAEIERLLNACEPTFRILVRAALETGCRYAELCRLACGDFNPDTGTLHIRKSKTGKERHVILTDDGISFFADLALGQPTDAPLLGKWWKRTEQTRWFMLACRAAKLDGISFHGLRHTWASLSVMSGMPLLIVARNLGHANTRMVEAHYGHLEQGYVTDQIRQHAPKLGMVA
jgi:integrase